MGKKNKKNADKAPAQTTAPTDEVKIEEPVSAPVVEPAADAAPQNAAPAEPEVVATAASSDAKAKPEISIIDDKEEE